MSTVEEQARAEAGLIVTATETTRELDRRGLSAADTCRHMGWTAGTHLVGDEGYGPTVIRLTAIGERLILAACVSRNGVDDDRGESLWTLGCRDWSEVTP